mmetsp:Transcript_19870/g.46486  ORF Transcript_19870/g.46486 Transcript_19870/m.46486 type:complete len:131 (+) Transcript_19870:57-449(+)
MGTDCPDQLLLRFVAGFATVLLVLYVLASALVMQRILSLWTETASKTDARELEATEPPICSICLCDCESDSCRTKLPCSHVFHQECLNQWWYKSGKPYLSCPLCRRNFGVEVFCRWDEPPRACADRHEEP